MNVNNANYKRLTAFALILIAVSTLLTYLILICLGAVLNKLPSYVQLLISTPTVPAVYAALFSLFDKHLWKHPFFKWAGIIIADDLNGRWTGSIKSSYDGFKTEIPAELNIRQTGTSIKIHGKFAESRSVSIYENFGRSEMLDQTALYYFYKNDPNYDAPPTMAMHEGSTILTFNAQTQVLSGYYYSGRDRNNHGTIKLTRTS